MFNGYKKYLLREDVIPEHLVETNDQSNKMINNVGNARGPLFLV